MHLNNKLIISIILSFILIGGGYLLASGAEDSPEISRTEIIKDKNIFSINSSGIEVDSDKDGLLDWEETLWGTDPGMKDSDGDGTDDGDEVRDKRDPTKPGPDDSLESGAPRPFDPEIDLNNTGQFGVDFLSAYLSLRDLGRLGEDSANTLLGTLSGNISELGKLTQYEKADLNIILSNSLSDIKRYANDLGLIFLSEVASLQDNELAIFIGVIEGIDDTENLTPIINTHKRILNKLIDISVPGEVSDLHLDFVNDYSAVVQSIENMSVIENEPLIAVIGISQYKAATDQLTRTKNNLSEYFDLKGLDFDDEEAGVIFQ